jgi:hypothetical protein
MNDTTKADALDGIEPRAWIYEDPNMHQPVSTIYKGVAARIPNEPLYDRAAIEAAIERARADERERCAVTAWNHYMDTCIKRRLAPADNGHFIAAQAIRALGATGERHD